MPICLPWSESDPQVGNLGPNARATVSGWGKMTNNANFTINDAPRFRVAARKLNYVELPVIPNEEFNSDAFCRRLDPEVHICAGGEPGKVPARFEKEACNTAFKFPGKDSCNGDSGGPLAYQTFIQEPWYQLGIVSYGTPVCGVGQGAAYTKVSVFMDWIDSQLKP